MINKIANKKSQLFNVFKRINKPKSHNHYDQEGIYHDSNFVHQCLNNCKRLYQSTIDQLKNDFLLAENLITMVYLSSGVDNVNRFSELSGINNIILIDYQFKEYSCIELSDNRKIYCIPSEVVVASSILEKAGISSIDILIDINCGINLGFGFFSVSSALVLSTYETICNKEKLIFIGSKEYLKKNQQYGVSKSYLNCFQHTNRKTIKSTDYSDNGLNFDLNILTTYEHSCHEFDITLFENKVTEPIVNVIEKGNLTIHFIKGNIFDYKNKLDIIFLYFRNIFMLEQFNNSFSNVLDFRGSYFNLSNREIYEMSKPQDIIRMTKSTANSIGFVPLKGYDYVTLINGFSKQNNSSTDLYFFYYDKTDLTDIYKIDEIK